MTFTALINLMLEANFDVIIREGRAPGCLEMVARAGDIERLRELLRHRLPVTLRVDCVETTVAFRGVLYVPRDSGALFEFPEVKVPDIECQPLKLPGGRTRD